MLKVIISSVFAFFLVGATALAASPPKKPTGNSGLASVYSQGPHGRTASGERLVSTNLTGAHRTLPFGTRVQVTNRRNGHSVVVRINDRGPFIRGRVIDVTPAAARALGFSGLAPVMLTVLGRS
jgi:rare lipoprotein A